MVKRLFDLVVVVIALSLFSAVLLILCFFVAMNMGLPVIFKQTRPGLNTKPFNMIKFRTNGLMFTVIVLIFTIRNAKTPFCCS